uniref:Uncharacterized protein n=1 Tax=Rhizophora mucronata TaxID=61149 RepID=A0A2P2QNL0_RHIMU
MDLFVISSMVVTPWYFSHLYFSEGALCADAITFAYFVCPRYGYIAVDTVQCSMLTNRKASNDLLIRNLLMVIAFWYAIVNREE